MHLNIRLGGGGGWCVCFFTLRSVSFCSFFVLLLCCLLVAACFGGFCFSLRSLLVLVLFPSYCLFLPSPLYYPAGLRPRISLCIRHDIVLWLSPRCPTKLFLSGSLVAISRSHKALYTQFRGLLPSHCMYWLTGCKTPSYLLTHCMYWLTGCKTPSYLLTHCMYWLTGCNTPSYLLTHCRLSHHVEGKTFSLLFFSHFPAKEMLISVQIWKVLTWLVWLVPQPHCERVSL